MPYQDQTEILDHELESLLAHELYHATHDLKRIELLRFFSVVLLSPAYSLLLLHDFDASERRADDFAISVVGDSAPLISGLTKLSVIGVPTHVDSRMDGPRQPVQNRPERIARWEQL